MSGLLSVYLGMFSFVEGYPHYLGGGGVSSSPQKVLITTGGKVDQKLTVLMISFCSTDDIIHLSLLLGNILPMEVLLDFQDGRILEFGGFEIDIT